MVRRASSELGLPFRMVREHHPRRALGAAYAAGAMLLSVGSSLGAALLLVSTIGFYEVRYGPLEEAGWEVGVAGFVLLVLTFWSVMAVLPRCIRLFGKGRRLMAPGPASVLRSRRAPVLLLRSFADDELAALSNPAFLLSSNRYEDRLARALRGAGPPLAIGRPGGGLPQTGATRLYVDDAEWQTAVRYFLESAGLVVVIVGPTQGVVWETLESALRVPPEKLIFVFPKARLGRALIPMFERRGGMRGGAAEASPESEKEARFALFRELIAPVGRLQVPSSIGRGQFLVFEPDGTGRFVENRWTLSRWVMLVNPILWLMYALIEAMRFLPWRMTFEDEISFHRTLRPVVQRARRRASPREKKMATANRL